MAELVELSAEHRFVEFKLRRPENLTTQIVDEPLLLGASTASVPGEVRARYHRDRDESEVWAEIWVAGNQPLLEFTAVVAVRIHYRGDAVRAGTLERKRVNERLLELAHSACLEQMKQEAMPDRLIASSRLDEAPRSRRKKK